MEKILEKEFLKNIKVESSVRKNESIKLIDLDRSMFKDKPEILAKYFRNKNGQDCVYANLYGYLEVRDTMSMQDLHKNLRKDFGCNVNLKGYVDDENHFKYGVYDTQTEFEDDLYREKSKEEEMAEWEQERRSAVESLDFDAVTALTEVLFMALKSRYVMVLNLETVPGLINNAFDCYYKGVSCGASNLALHAKIKEIRTLLEDSTVIEWLKAGASDMNFDRYDYVTTYQRVLRTMTDIRDISLEEIRSVIHNDNDVLEDEIISNDLLEQSESLNENLIYIDEATGKYVFVEDEDSDEYLENNEIFG